MPQIELDSSLTREERQGFKFPLGVTPVEPVTPRPGYVLEFEPADGGEPFEGAEPTPSEVWEEWPDRFMFDILVSHERLGALARSLLSLLPGRIYPILDVLGNDSFREVDPYIAYDQVGFERFMDGLIQLGPWLFEDGLVGFGAMSLDPFFYVFVDEHKAITVRTEMSLKERVQKLLAAFDLKETREIAGADSVAHEHRCVLKPPAEDGAGLHAEEIVEQLRDRWALQLNVDTRTNVDDGGRELGITAWRCVMRCTPDAKDAQPVYAEVFLAADCLDTAERLLADVAAQRAGDSDWADVVPVLADRCTPETAAAMAEMKEPPTLDVNRVIAVRWFEGETA
ncbi:MAG: hypothetical protein KDA20_08275 [Phycisphaerales bacterium]|nr:hypothetical protein [Phycisphaerales bacterium]